MSAKVPGFYEFATKRLCLVRRSIVAPKQAEAAWRVRVQQSSFILRTFDTLDFLIL